MVVPDRRCASLEREFGGSGRGLLALLAITSDMFAASPFLQMRAPRRHGRKTTTSGSSRRAKSSRLNQETIQERSSSQADG
jgi:hypothetical protein